MSLWGQELRVRGDCVGITQPRAIEKHDLAEEHDSGLPDEASGGCAMDNATGDDLGKLDQDQWDLDQWLEIPNAGEEKTNRRNKKRRRQIRKNRKPSRPANYIGQRSNNHLLRIFSEE